MQIEGECGEMRGGLGWGGRHARTARPDPEFHLHGGGKIQISPIELSKRRRFRSAMPTTISTEKCPSETNVHQVEQS